MVISIKISTVFLTVIHPPDTALADAAVMGSWWTESQNILVVLKVI